MNNAQELKAHLQDSNKQKMYEAKKMAKCEKCGSKNLDYRSNHEWGEEWNEDNEDNIIQCNDCDNEEVKDE